MRKSMRRSRRGGGQTPCEPLKNDEEVYAACQAIKTYVNGDDAYAGKHVGDRLKSFSEESKDLAFEITSNTQAVLANLPEDIKQLIEQQKLQKNVSVKPEELAAMSKATAAVATDVILKKVVAKNKAAEEAKKEARRRYMASSAENDPEKTYKVHESYINDNGDNLNQLMSEIFPGKDFIKGTILEPILSCVSKAGYEGNIKPAIWKEYKFTLCRAIPSTGYKKGETFDYFTIKYKPRGDNALKNSISLTGNEAKKIELITTDGGKRRRNKKSRKTRRR